MTTPTHTEAVRDSRDVRRRGPRGLLWLMVRQHRTALLACLAVTVLGAAWILYQRGAMLDTLHGAGWPAGSADSLDGDLLNRVTNRFDSAASTLASLPALLGACLGAALIAPDLEHGTARLVTTQSVPRDRWLLAKAGFALTLVTVTTLPLGLLFGWWRDSIGPFAGTDWLHDAAFDASAPVLVATALFTSSLGLLIGALTRRAVSAIVLTLLASWAAMVAGDVFKDDLATPRRISFPFGTDVPAALDHVVQVDQWVGTASGKLYGWGTCVHDASPDACRARLGIVNSVWEYFGDDQRMGLEWTAAAVLVAASAVLIALFLWRLRRAPLTP
ncbi:ABC transporter permease [Streptomyces sp. NBC_00539]|uniref:ABC transporter permease n=1 Tax=Streptomyces sp. NBC_00539 TaxID=2975770 RepID=UPI002E7FEF60|nr:ABC transporter permease [Streptomyces sp. NBC_00539]WUC63217.1 ABC transporter permease [Streptomyces sp. NBC_00539]